MPASMSSGSAAIALYAYDAAAPYDTPVPYNGSPGSMTPAARATATITGGAA